MPNEPLISAPLITEAKALVPLAFQADDPLIANQRSAVEILGASQAAATSTLKIGADLPPRGLPAHTHEKKIGSRFPDRKGAGEIASEAAAWDAVCEWAWARGGASPLYIGLDLGAGDTMVRTLLVDGVPVHEVVEVAAWQI